MKTFKKINGCAQPTLTKAQQAAITKELEQGRKSIDQLAQECGNRGMKFEAFIRVVIQNGYSLKQFDEWLANRPEESKE